MTSGAITTTTRWKWDSVCKAQDLKPAINSEQRTKQATNPRPNMHFLIGLGLGYLIGRKYSIPEILALFKTEDSPE